MNFLKASKLILLLSVIISTTSCSGNFQKLNSMRTSEDYYDIHSSSEKVCLNGEWMFCFDQQGKGLEKEYFKNPSNKEDWKDINVPSTYNLGDDREYQGKTWYVKSVNLTADQLKDKQAVMRFLGVALRCKLWVNGEKAGENIYGWIPFEFDVSKSLKPGKNTIVMLVDNEILELGIPDNNWDGWWNYGGIFRDVYLDFRPVCNVKNLYTETIHQDDKWAMAVKAELVNKSRQLESCEVSVNLMDENGKVIWMEKVTKDLQPGTNQISMEKVISGVEGWTPKNPKLYNLVCSVENSQIHEYKIYTAFRDIRVDGSQILLNSKPLLIHGICVHEEYPGVGNALTKEMYEQTLDGIKELNSNFVRTGHYTNHPYFYDYCNKIGLLVWTEIPAWKTKDETMSNPEVFKTYALDQLEAMVEQYRKYPCVVIWSVGNEFNSDQPVGRDYVKKTCEHVKSLDSSRIVTFASSRHRQKVPVGDNHKVSDLTYEFIDVIAINEYYGWYYGTNYSIGAKLDQINRMYPDKPVMISETGAGAAPDGNIERKRQDRKKKYTLENQCEHHETHMGQIFEELRRHFVAGSLIWVYADFKDPHRTAETHPIAWQKVNLKGLVSFERKKKPAFGLVQKKYKELSEFNK